MPRAGILLILILAIGGCFDMSCQKGEPMIIITAEWKAKPGQETALARHLAEMVDAVRKNEPACLQYTLHRGHDDKTRFYFYERYEDLKAVDLHKNTPHFKKLIAATEQLIAEPVRVSLYQVVK